MWDACLLDVLAAQDRGDAIPLLLECVAVISGIFEDSNADVIQRPDNLDAILIFGGMHVRDGTAPDTLHPK